MSICHVFHRFEKIGVIFLCSLIKLFQNNSFRRLVFEPRNQILIAKGCETHGYCYPRTRYCSCYFTILEQIVTLRGLYALSSNIILAENS